jgi:hypothetical protein
MQFIDRDQELSRLNHLIRLGKQASRHLGPPPHRHNPSFIGMVNTSSLRLSNVGSHFRTSSTTSFFNRVRVQMIFDVNCSLP